MMVIVLFSRYLFFFFKQKTAYEMRISDWSSDVCSSDLRGNRPAVCKLLEHARQHRLDRVEDVILRHEAHLEVELIEFAGRAVGARILVAKAGRDLEIAVEARDHQIGRASCRERVCQYV